MTLHEFAIFTDDVDGVADFYERLLNVKPSFRGEGIAIFTFGDNQILVHRKYVPAPGDPPCENHAGFAVENVDETLRGLEQRGVHIEIPVRTYPWGRSAYLRDPEGHLLEISERST